MILMIMLTVDNNNNNKNNNNNDYNNYNKYKVGGRAVVCVIFATLCVNNNHTNNIIL